MPFNAWNWIKIDAQLVGMFKIARADRVRVKLDAAQVSDPGEPGDVVDNNLFRRAPGRKRECDSSQPRRSLSGSPLLIERFSLSTVDETLKDNRTVPYPRQRARGNRQVKAHKIEL